MTYALWQRDREVAISSPRVVLRAAEVPVLEQAEQLRERLHTMLAEHGRRHDAAYAQAHAQGLADGLEQGRAAARDEQAARLLDLAAAADRERAQLRGEVGALALQVARKLMGQLAADAQLVALAETAVADLVGDMPLTLVVHPSQEAAVRAHLAATSERAFEVRSEPGCAEDTCRIETAFGSIDASLGGQLERLAAAWGVQR